MVETRDMGKRSWPTVRRLILAAELRRLRHEAGQSIKEVEEACDLGKNSLYKYENCVVSMAPNTAKRLFEHFGVDKNRINDLIAIAKSARQRNVVQRQTDALSDVPEWFNLFVMLEQEASRKSELELTLVPGLLQTRRYMEALMRAGHYGADVRKLVEARVARQGLLDDDEPLELWAIIHEGALRRAVGGATVMREQLDHLITMAARPNVTIQVIPNEFGAHVSQEAGFALIEFKLAPDFTVVYTEHLDEARYRDDPEDVDRYVRAYRHLIKAALPEEQSVQLIQKVREELFT